MMIRHVWTIPCRHCITDRETNNVTLVEVIEELAIPVAPPVQGQPLPRGFAPAIFQVVTLWEREQDDTGGIGHGRMSLLGPQGDVLHLAQYDVDLQQHMRTRQQIVMFGFPSQGQGRYQFRVERQLENGEWQEEALIPLRVLAAQ
jgi:hypothetical protein